MLPFILLFTVVILIVPIITIALFDQKYDEQVSRETQEWLEAIVETGFIHEAEKVKEAYGAEVTVVGNDNTVNSTTLPGNWTNFARDMKLDEVRKRIKESNRDFVSQNVIVNEKHYKVIYYPQEYNRLYCLMRPMDKIAACQARDNFIDVRYRRCRYPIGWDHQPSYRTESYQSD